MKGSSAMTKPLFSRGVFTLAALATLGLAPQAQASWLQPHTLQEAIPLPEVERSLVTGKSRMLFSLDFSWKQSASHFTGGDSLFNLGFTEGTHFVKEANNGRWTYRRFELGVAWGITRNLDLYADVPIVWASVVNDLMVNEDGGRDATTSVGLGDIHSGMHFQFLRHQSEDGKLSNSFIGQFDARMPTGFESPGSYLPGPNNVPTIITGTGSWGFDFSLRYKQQLAVLAVEAGLGFTWNPVATVMYLVDDQENQFNQHIDPGDVVHGDVGVTVQFFDHLALRGDVDLEYRTVTKWGRTVQAFPACKECTELEGSNGFWMTAGARLISDFSVHFGVDAYFQYTLAGRRNFLWPLEELSPSRGWTAGLDLAYRF